MIRTFLILFLISGINLLGIAQSKYTISGYIKEQGSSELLLGVTVYVPSLSKGASTNSYGFYSLTLPTGKYKIKCSFIGYKTEVVEVDLTQDIVQNIFIAPMALALEEVVIVADDVEKVSETSQISAIRLPVESVANIPAFLGEKDVLKTIQLMPGVQSGSEGNSGLYVRGGGPDQNLIILDDATVYNANHLFGFFSIFNGDAIKSVEVYKGGFPARFGGRISSVIKMDMKDGNKEEVHGKVGVGILSSNVTLEGPIKKGKTSFLVNGRRTYFDLLTLPFQESDEKLQYFFYDFNAKINHEFNNKNKLYFSGYFGRDKFLGREERPTSKRDQSLSWGNYTATVRWNHQFNKKWFSNTSLIFSKYDLEITENRESSSDKYSSSYLSNIRDYSFKYDVDYFPNPNHAIKLGLATISHRFSPSSVVKEGPQGTTNNAAPFNSLESAVYIEDDMKFFGRLNVNAGIRLSHFIHEKVDYIKPEPRISLGYQLVPDLSIKASYTSMNQYIHLLSNSGMALPTDLWVSSTDRIKPQTSEQVAIGIAKDFPEKNLALTVEGYYKKSKNVISYKEGASFLVLDDLGKSSERVSWEDNITAGNATSYGVEVFFQKRAGKFTGWLGYTLSRTEFQFDELNFGRPFLAKYDRTHDVSLVGIYKKSDKITLSATWVYGTGNNISLPVGTYRSINLGDRNNFFTDRVKDYGGRNQFRAEAYHRLDFAIQFHKKKKRGLRTWELALYNVYNRRNPFYYFVDSIDDNDTGGTTNVLKKISILPIIPSFKYTFEF